MEGTPEQQMQQLREEYERRLNEIKNSQTPEVPESEANEAQDSADHILAEHRAVSETTENMIQQVSPEFKAESHQEVHSLDGLSEEDHAKVQSWINIAEHDPYASVKMAADSKDPALMQALHRGLTNNEKFANMVKGRKLVEV